MRFRVSLPAPFQITNMTTQKRKVERLDGDQWVEILFKDIRKGDIIQLYEPTGEKVTDDPVTALDDPIPNKKGILGFKIDS